MPRTFDCPKCGAPISYSDHPEMPGFNVKCNYCGSTIAEPSMGRPAHVVQVNIGGPSVKIPKAFWLVLLLIPGIGIVVAVIAMVAGFSTAFRTTTVRDSPSARSTPSTSEPKGGIQPVESNVATLMKFGSKGIGPGMFTDARSIAVDGSGNIYVGEYSGGRIQVFDPTGKFMTQWSVDPKMPLRGLAADRKGIVYVVQSGKIKKHDGETGSDLGEVGFPEGWGFDDISSTADGGLVCAWYKNRDDIVRFDSSGKVTRQIKAAISSVSGDSELNTRVAIDGLGNTYALGTFNNAVFKFGPDGKYVNRFGSDGDQPGQFRAAQAIAADGKGRVFVSDMKGIQMFDADGRYLDVFRPDGATASGMVFNDKDELFIVAREKVLKVALKK